MRFPFGLIHCVVSCNSQKLLPTLVGYAKRKWHQLSQVLPLFLTLFSTYFFSSIELFSSFKQPLAALGATERE